MNKRAEKYLLSVVTQNYNDIAHDFSVSREKDLLPMVLEIITKLNIKSGDKILDLGCGNGRLVKSLPAEVSYLGLDNSLELIKLAQKKYSNEKNIFQNKNILNIEEIENFDFNYIFCLAVFHHLPGEKKQLSFLKQLYEKMDEKTILILSVWKLRFGFKFFKIFFKSFFSQLFKGRVLNYGDLLFYGFKQHSLRYYHAFSIKELKKIIKKSGFNIFNLSEDKYNYYLILKK
ncbi:MAG TPA: class I SAM-dependent methyltransferase [bacterium]|nr:class I SAM-dependent methyltransferase [bacterium]